MFGSNAYVSPATTTSRKMCQIASRSASVALRIFIAVKQHSRATASVATIPAAIGVQITQRARRAFALPAMAHPSRPPIAEDSVSHGSVHRSTVSTEQPRRDKRCVRAERQRKSHGHVKLAPVPTEITCLRGHAREYEDLQCWPDLSGFPQQARRA